MVEEKTVPGKKAYWNLRSVNVEWKLVT